MAAVLRSFDIFCLSSTFEGFPNALGEAMAMALPCVTTDAGDARVLAGEVTDGVTVVPISNPQAMATALLALARLTPEERSQLGASSRQRVVNHYTVDVMRRQFEAVYRSVAQPDSRPVLLST